MAKIKGPPGGHATLAGTAASDLIIALGDDNTVSGGGGNDTIFATQGNDNRITIGQLGDGNTQFIDTIRVDGVGDSVLGGDETVRLAGMANSSSVTLGNGNDHVSLLGSGNTILLGAGSDSINAAGGSDTVHVAFDDGSGYTDRIAISGQNNVVSNTQTVGEYTGTGTIAIHGGSGNNSFVFDSAIGTIDTSGTGNVITILDYGSEHIVAGSGSDRVSLGGFIGGSNGQQVIALAGQDNSVTGVAGNATISGGAGANFIDLSGPDVGGGSLTLKLGGLGNAMTITAAHTTVDAGTGQDTVSLQSAVGSVTFHGSYDSLVLGGPEIYAGLPNAYVDDRSAGLAVALQAGGAGNLTIDHLDAAGVIAFDGRGGFTSVSQVMGDLHATGNGNYSLVLPDGSGTISILDTPNLNASNFKIG